MHLFIRFSLLIFLVCALFINSNAQTFEWESTPCGELCDIRLVKIQETIKGDFFLTGNNDETKVGCYQLNRFGKLKWKVNPKTFSAGLTDIFSLDSNSSFLVIGQGNVLPETDLLLKINDNGIIEFEKEILTRNYDGVYFYTKLYNNKLLTCGYRFGPFPLLHPIIEYRSLQGDTLGKFEVKSSQYCKAQKIFALKGKVGFLLFGNYDYLAHTIVSIQTDTLGNILKENVFGEDANGYNTNYYDLVEKDSSYYLLGDFSFKKSEDWDKDGTYIFQFNKEGDSVNFVLINGNLNTFLNLQTLAPTHDNGFIVAGESLLKLDSHFKIEWKKDFKTGVLIKSVKQAADGGYYGAGSYFDAGLNRWRMYAFKTDSQGNIDHSKQYPDMLIYPNPVKDILKLDLPYAEDFLIQLIDLHGRVCIEYPCTGSSMADMGALCEGVYLLRINDSNGKPVKTLKLLKQD